MRRGGFDADDAPKSRFAEEGNIAFRKGNERATPTPRSICRRLMGRDGILKFISLDFEQFALNDGMDEGAYAKLASFANIEDLFDLNTIGEGDGRSG